MSQKTTLVLLTQKFPFESGEEFIANEMEYLESSFDEIILIPTAVRDYSQRRNVGERVRVERISNPEGTFEIFRNFLNYFFESIPYFFSELRQSNYSVVAGKYLLYHVPFGLKIRNRVLQLLNDQSSFACYSYWMDTNAFALALSKKKHPEIKFIIRTHGGDLYDERSDSGRICFRNLVYQKADLIAPISFNGKNYLNTKYPEFSNKVKEYRLGVQDNGLGPLEYSSSAFKVISCSSIIPIKRLDKIFSVLSNCGTKIEWTHFGGSQNEIDELKEKFQVSTEQDLTFISNGSISNQDLMSFYKNNFVDLFINLSASEGIPVSIMEATSFGIPVLSNEVGGIPEIVTPSTGWIVKVDDEIEKIRALIIEIKNSGATKNTLFRKGVRKFWLENFNASKNYSAFIDQLKKNQFKLN